MKNEINLTLELDENKIPENIIWSATEGGMSKSEAKAFILAIWDKKTDNTLKMDLWTKEMSVEEMFKFYFQTFMTMADSFQKSTNEDGMADAIRDFAEFFGEKLGVIAPSGKFDK